MSDSADLTSLIASRICHDLISPIGAIGNGVELLGLDGRHAGPELQLLADSVAQANARIRFFRIAFGAAAQDQRIARSEVMSILADLAREGRVRFAWTSGPDLARREVRLAFLLILCAESALAYGGRIEVVETSGNWTLAAEAPRLRIEPALWDGLQGAAPALGLAAAEVQFALVPGAVARLGRRLVTELTPQAIRFSF